MKKLALAILLSITTSAFAVDRSDEVRKTEMAFAKTFADRDTTRFFSFIAEDARFVGGRRILANKKEIREVWSGYLKGPAPFSWKPDRVLTNDAGNLGLSTGPVFGPDGKEIGSYWSTWKRQADGSWKIIFDGGSPLPCPADGSNGVEEGFIHTEDGARLHYSKTGRGLPIVIMPAELFLFDDFKQLGDQATVVAYDMRNRGHSSKVALDKVSIQNDVRDLETVRRHFNTDRFVPIGFSYLGLMVGLYALDHPERVERMIQLGPISMVANTEYPAELTHGDDDVAAAAADVKRWREMQASGGVVSSPREYCETDWKVMQFVLVGNAASASKAKGHCDLETEWPVNLQPHFGKTFESINKLTVTRDDFRRITMPVLTIHGTFDRNAPYGSGREWASTLPNGRLLTVPGAAHLSWLDAPDVVIPAIRQFLKGEWPKEAEKPK